MKSFAASLICSILPLCAALAEEPPTLPARVKAVGITGAGAVAQVGLFHPGGPIHDDQTFAAFTNPGRVLDAKRVFVASGSNFGAPLALPDEAEGAVLSLDPDESVLVIPDGFAAAGGQASTADSRIQLYAAQSPAFVNGIHTPGATSAKHPSVSNTLGISLNNAFGRIWFANAPHGSGGIGTLSIDDPTGEPFAHAFSPLFGGLFAGNVTNRPEQIVPGSLSAGAVATALMGFSPDGSGRGVFAVLTADGAIGQAHAEAGLDGLAPAGTLAPLTIPASPDADAAITRAGMIFNWVPNRILYVAEPSTNAIVAVSLTQDDEVFRVSGIKRLTAPELETPIDLAPVVAEIANREFSSNTTLAGNSDFYVANRGNGTIVRMRQDGTVVEVRRVTLPDGTTIGANRLNGIAVSPDAQTIWLTVSGTVAGYPDAPGVLLEAPAFGPGHAALAIEPDALASMGAEIFAHSFTPTEGLGPLFNASSCLECHHTPTPGGMGKDGLGLASRVGRLEGDTFDELAGKGGPFARTHSVAEFGVACDLAPGPPPAANVISIRNAPSLYGAGLIDSIPDEIIRAGAASRPGLKGRVNVVKGPDGSERVGRFGWKAGTATLGQFVGQAFRNELGITNPVEPLDLVSSDSCGGKGTAMIDDGSMVRAVTAYLTALAPPTSVTAPHPGDGAELFEAAGCTGCHTPVLPGAAGSVPLYSDLLLHDMGASLADGVTDGSAEGVDWRTTPLWGLGKRPRFLHDGRATTIREAILAHGGDAAEARAAFHQLPEKDRADLLAFLSTL